MKPLTPAAFGEILRGNAHMKRFAVLLVALMALCAPAHAQEVHGYYPLQVSDTPGCAQSTTYLAAVSGLSITEWNAFDAAICGIVADGNFAVLDAMYFYANASAANGQVNVAAPGTHNLTSHGSCTFTADQGFTGDGSSCYQDPGFNPSTAGGHWVQDSVIIGVCILNARVTPSSGDTPYGASDGTHNVYLVPYASGPVADFTIHDANQTYTPTSSQGSIIITRTNSGGGSAFLNGTDVNDWGGGSSGILNANFISMADNNNGTIVNFTTDQLGYWFFGSALSAPASIQVYNRLHTMIAALGNSAC